MKLEEIKWVKQNPWESAWFAIDCIADEIQILATTLSELNVKKSSRKDKKHILKALGKLEKEIREEANDILEAWKPSR